MRAAWTFLPLLAMFLAACSKERAPVSVTGKITRNGQPLAVGPRGLVRVIFVPDVSARDVHRRYPGRYDLATGRYAVSGLPVGRYRIAVAHLEAAHPDKDLLNNA